MSREATAGNPGTGSREGKFIEYSSNNSGGAWWLTDEDWENLEKAGWKVCWFSRQPLWLDGWKRKLGEDGLPLLVDTRPGDPLYHGGGRWLGARAMYAYRAGLTLEEAKAEFAKITGQDPEDQGCLCCGQPHWFSEEVGVYV